MIYQVHEIEVFEGIVSFIVMFIFLIGLILSVISLQKNRSQTKFFVILLMISGFLYTFSNIFEKFEMWDRADEFGDSFILFFATILLIIGVVVILEEKLHTSEKKYREAYNRLNFYKDLGLEKGNLYEIFATTFYINTETSVLVPNTSCMGIRFINDDVIT